MPDAPLRCRECGSDRFIVPDHSTDESLVTCADCDAEIGRWGDVRVGILEEAKEVKGARKAKRRTA
jgi:hypothetical protein